MIFSFYEVEKSRGHYKKECFAFPTKLLKTKRNVKVFNTPLKGTTLASAFDIGLRLFDSNKKLAPEWSS